MSHPKRKDAASKEERKGEYTASQEKRPCGPLKPLWYKSRTICLLENEKEVLKDTLV
jgi:hypothetical protein